MNRRSFRTLASALAIGLTAGSCTTAVPTGKWTGYYSDYHRHDRLIDLAETEIGGVALHFDGDGRGKLSGRKDGKPFIRDFSWSQTGGAIRIFPDAEDKTLTLSMDGADRMVFTDREFRVRVVFLKAPPAAGHEEK